MSRAYYVSAGQKLETKFVHLNFSLKNKDVLDPNRFLKLKFLRTVKFFGPKSYFGSNLNATIKNIFLDFIIIEINLAFLQKVLRQLLSTIILMVTYTMLPEKHVLQSRL